MNVPRRQSGTVWAFLLTMTLTASVAAAQVDFAAVPEMVVPEGIQTVARAEREALAASRRAPEVIEHLEREVRSRWAGFRSLDLSDLSRWDAELTRGFSLPARPDSFTGRVIGHDASTDTWFVELRAAKLPAEYAVVTRYLTFYAGVRLSAGNAPALISPTVTIRREVRE